MDPDRQLERVTLADAAAGLAAGRSIRELVEDLMGKKRKSASSSFRRTLLGCRNRSGVA